MWRWQYLWTQAGAMAAGLSPGTTSYSRIRCEAGRRQRRALTFCFLGWNHKKSRLWVPEVSASDDSHGSSLTVCGRGVMEIEARVLGKLGNGFEN